MPWMPVGIVYPAMLDDLISIKASIRSSYRCDCHHHSTTVVQERYAGKSWTGRVEIWSLEGHPRAQYCYGWREATGEVVTVLQISPVISPSTAVRWALQQRFSATREAVVR